MLTELYRPYTCSDADIEDTMQLLLLRNITIEQFVVKRKFKQVMLKIYNILLIRD
jgi:hypothetical protein